MSLSASKTSNSAIKSFFYYAVVVLIFLYAFSIPSFGGRATYNLIMYGVMGLLAFSTVAYYLVSGIKPNFKKWQIYLIPLFVLFAFIGTAIYSHSFRDWLSLVFLAASFFVLYFDFKIIDDKNIIALLLSTAIACFCIYFIFHYRNDILNFESFGTEGFRLGTYFDNQNVISAVCVIGIAASLYLILFHKSRLKYILLVPFLLITIVGLSTGSRTFVVAYAVILLTMFFFKFRKHKVIYIFIVAVIFLIAIILLNLPFAYTIKERFERFFNTLFTDTSRVDTSAIERMIWFDYGFYLGFKNIITGYGVNGFGIYSGVGTYAHSNLAEVICDFGILGTLLFYTPLAIILSSTIVKRKKCISYVFPIIAYYVVVSFSNVFYYNKFYYFNLAFLYYLAFENMNKTIKIKDIKKHVKNIVFTCEGMECGGAEKVIATLANEFSDRGFNVSIVGVATRNPESFYKLNDSVSFEILHKGTNKKFHAFKRVRLLNKTLKSLKPDVVISFLPHVIVYTDFAMSGIKAPLIVSERNNPATDPKELMLRLLKLYAYHHADGCVFQTNDAKEYFSDSIQNKSTIIANPIDPSIDYPVAKKRTKTIISVGRLNEQKNYPCLINAFELFYKNHPDYELKIYGDGPLKESIEQLIDEKNLGDSVTLMGKSNTWHKDENDASMFALTSDFEGMPNALAEAIALGIPCVATDCPIGGSKELIIEGQNGYLAKINNPEDVANKMEKALKLKIYQYDVYEFIEKRTPKAIASEWLDFAKDVLERSSAE